ncbi:archaetidylserine decarboxylase [Alicyclobacillus fastidiosus]|uniref:phosphatidylserine decarboxylase n=1 Tax=Alicyclobacillus fastidiosus TaxID=392011 RepID=A0ABY6ZC16_9BACL|nr:archaetidylserine decarboxylase [Alicyclobacillus fastidiosus]WAH40389.1 archaetidylserine decarboxylase [Alicyclobacillus fastidiosus]GMA61779.1 phosphatidylserine decarboxylase proenzyme [Alicyclobacillus fastidiosus]
MKSFVIKCALRLMPKRAYTSLLGTIVGSRWSARLIPWYARHFSVDVDELAKPIDEHMSLGEFFSRKLSAKARPISVGLVSPVDGVVSSMGRIDGYTLLQVKGQTYTLNEFLADDIAAERYAHGWYITLYLSPSDYHRIHAPTACTARHYRHIPGALYPVNAHGVQHIPKLFVQNERVITYFDSADGPFVMAKVGAAGVGTVIVPFGELPSRRNRTRGQVRDASCHETFAKGEEVGYFALGSTVVLLFPSSFPLRFVVESGEKVRMGHTIATVVR